MGNKIGYHIQAASAMEQLFQFLASHNYRSGGFTVVGSPGQIYNVVARLGPDKSKIVARDTDLEDAWLDPAKGSLLDPVLTAKTFVDTLRQKIKNLPGLEKLMWQVFNERMGDYKWMDKVVIAIIDYNETLKPTEDVPFGPLKFVFYNYATGNPEPFDWAELRTSLTKVCLNPRHKIGLHEYGYGGKMLNPPNDTSALEGYRIASYKTLRNLLVQWGLPIDGKLVINEYGLDDPGYIDAHVTLLNCVKMCIAASIKYYESDKFVFSANTYDCSLLAFEYNVLPQDETGTHYEFLEELDKHILAAGGTQPSPEPEPVPTPVPTPTPQPPVETLVDYLKNPKFDMGFTKVTADHTLPNKWKAWQKLSQTRMHYEGEQHPTHFDPSAVNWAARFYTGYEALDGGLSQIITVVPGQTYKLTAEVFKWCTQEPVVDTPSQGVTVSVIGLDPMGGSDPFAPSVIWSFTNNMMDKLFMHDVVAQAVGDKMTVYLRGWAPDPFARNDFFWSDLKLYRVGEVTPAPVPTLKPYVKAGYRLRTSADSSNTSNVMLVTGAEVPVVIEREEGNFNKLSVYVAKEGTVYK